jgi:hypothetical protein
MYQDAVGIEMNPIGASTNDYLRMWNIYPSDLTHRSIDILLDGIRKQSENGFFWLSSGMFHHLLTDYKVDGNHVFKKATEIAKDCPPGLINLVKPEQVTQEEWEENRDKWYRNKLVDLALCYGVLKIDERLPEVITEWKYRTSTDELAEGLYQIFGDVDFPQKMGTPEEEMQRVKDIIDENYQGVYEGEDITNFMKERSEEFERILGHDNVGLGNKAYFRAYIDSVSKTIKNVFLSYMKA